MKSKKPMTFLWLSFFTLSPMTGLAQELSLSAEFLQYLAEFQSEDDWIDPGLLPDTTDNTAALHTPDDVTVKPIIPSNNEAEEQ